jgi:hypothetical protein
MEPPIQDTRSTPSVAASGPSINAASLSLPAHPRRSASKNTRPRARGREGAAIGETETETEREREASPPSPPAPRTPTPNADSIERIPDARQNADGLFSVIRVSSFARTMPLGALFLDYTRGERAGEVRCPGPFNLAATLSIK